MILNSWPLLLPLLLLSFPCYLLLLLLLLLLFCPSSLDRPEIGAIFSCDDEDEFLSIHRQMASGRSEQANGKGSVGPHVTIFRVTESTVEKRAFHTGTTFPTICQIKPYQFVFLIRLESLSTALKGCDECLYLDGRKEGEETRRRRMKSLAKRKSKVRKKCCRTELNSGWMVVLFRRKMTVVVSGGGGWDGSWVRDRKYLLKIRKCVCETFQMSHFVAFVGQARDTATDHERRRKRDI